jgi:membrane glycosyltransferase
MDGLTHLVGPLLPPEAPLDMPTQTFATRPEPHIGHRPTAPRLILLRRLLVLGAALALTAAATHEMWQVLGLARWTTLGAVMTFLFAVLMLPLSLACGAATRRACRSRQRSSRERARRCSCPSTMKT